MKRFIISAPILIILVINSFNAFGEDWHWQNPLPQGNLLSSVDFVDEFTGFAVSDYGTVLKTVDGGGSWTIINTGVIDFFMSICFTDINTGYAVGYTGSIIKTTNSGVTWTLQNSGTNNILYSVYFINQDKGFAVGADGLLLKTTNGGTTWTNQNIYPTVYFLSDIYFVDSNIGYIVGYGGIVAKSIDGGTSWVTLTSGVYTSFLAVYFTDSNTGYAVGDFGYIWKTVDGGLHWTSQSSGITSGLKDVCFTNPNIGYCVGGNGNILKTTNGGNTWIPMISGTTKDLYSIHFLPISGSQTGLIVGIGGIILKTNNSGSTWNILTQGINNEFYSVWFSPQNPNIGYSVGKNGTIFKTNNSGLNWIPETSGTSEHLYSIFCIDSLTSFVSGAHGTILKTENGGISWTYLNSGINDRSLASIYFTDANNGCAIGSYGTILKTSDGGVNWSFINSGITKNLRSLYFTSSQIGYAVGDNGTILKTTNAGMNWTTLTSGTSIQLYSVCFTDENTGYISCDGGIILKTINGGNSWELINTGTESLLFSISLNNRNGSDVGYVVGGYGSRGTILKTANGFETWISHYSGTSNSLYCVAISDQDIGYAVGNQGTIISTFDNNYPSVDFSWITGCLYQPVVFNPDTIVTNLELVAEWLWDFGDPSSGNNNSSLQNPTHIYSAPGSYDVSLTITDTSGNSNTISHNIMIDSLPIADFYSDSICCFGDSMTFIDLSLPGVGLISLWNWDFGDPGSNNNTSVLQNPIHVFSNSGSYNIRLIVTNNEGCVDTTWHNVVVSPNPIASFNYTSVCDGNPVQFTDLSQYNGGGSIISWNWDFGDPSSGILNISNLPNPSHLFSAAGTFSVQLVIVTTYGCIDTIINQVIININPLVNAGLDQIITYGSSTILNGNVSGGSGNYQWFWEPIPLLIDPYVQNPVTVNLTASELFTLIVIDQENGCNGSDQVLITVIGGPLSVIVTATPNPVCTGSQMQLYALPSGGTGDNTFSWTSDPPGFYSNIQNPVDYPVTNTNYYVEVNDGNAIASDDVLVTVSEIAQMPDKPIGPDSVDLIYVLQSQYFITAVVNATSYQWELLPEDAGTISEQVTEATVYWFPDYLGNAYIKVRSQNFCGNSDWSVEKVTFIDNTTRLIKKNLDQLIIYPNPASTTLSIKNQRFISNECILISILDLRGKVQIEKSISGNDSQIDISSLPPGLYFVRLESDIRVEVGKFIKQ
jgi:photosystem II stability/assembly factor-like uncharacterized protein